MVIWEEKGEEVRRKRAETRESRNLKHGGRKASETVAGGKLKDSLRQGREEGRQLD